MKLADSATQTGDLDLRNFRPAGSLLRVVELSSLQRVLFSGVRVF